MSESWPWFALAALGAFHGLNPAMGWLFAVALGLHRRSHAVVLQSPIPIVLGHALAVALVALFALALDAVVEARVVRVTSAVVLIGWAVYHGFYGARHRVRVGMRTGMAGLALWSFLMATAHGAGLMLIPVLLPLAAAGSHAGHAAGHPVASGSLRVPLTAVAVHTLAMVTATGLIAVGIYEWVGLAFLRRGWINLDWLWMAALVATGLILLVTAAQ